MSPGRNIGPNEVATIKIELKDVKWENAFEEGYLFDLLRDIVNAIEESKSDLTIDIDGKQIAPYKIEFESGSVTLLVVMGVFFGGISATANYVRLKESIPVIATDLARARESLVRALSLRIGRLKISSAIKLNELFRDDEGEYDYEEQTNEDDDLEDGMTP